MDYQHPGAFQIRHAYRSRCRRYAERTQIVAIWERKGEREREGRGKISLSGSARFWHRIATAWPNGALRITARWKLNMHKRVILVSRRNASISYPCRLGYRKSVDSYPAISYGSIPRSPSIVPCIRRRDTNNNMWDIFIGVFPLLRYIVYILSDQPAW